MKGIFNLKGIILTLGIVESTNLLSFENGELIFGIILSIGLPGL